MAPAARGAHLFNASRPATVKPPPAGQPPAGVSRSGQLVHVPAIAMPRLELPSGITDTPISDIDRQIANDYREATVGHCLINARRFLRQARVRQRRAGRRGIGEAARAAREHKAAADGLVLAGIVCGIAELVRHGMSPVPERIARIRERCQERLAEEQPRFAVDVENWIHDLAGERRLGKG